MLCTPGQGRGQGLLSERSAGLLDMPSDRTLKAQKVGDIAWLEDLVLAGKEQEPASRPVLWASLHWRFHFLWFSMRTVKGSWSVQGFPASEAVALEIDAEPT